MSDYEVSLVNDSMQEFYVRFHGPAESKRSPRDLRHRSHSLASSSLRWRRLEDPRRAPRPVPFQVSQHRLHEQDIPPEYRRAVRAVLLGGLYLLIPAGQKRVRVSRRYQPDLVAHVRSAPFARSPLAPLLTGADMINIFEVFLPQLLRYPNPNDPLNGEAAALLMRHPKEYDAKVKGV